MAHIQVGEGTVVVENRNHGLESECLTQVFGPGTQVEHILEPPFQDGLE